MAGHCCLGTICRAGFLLLSKMDNFAATKKQAILSIPMKFSIIIPVYNRPNEVHELLESLSMQTLKDFEVLIIEDGSTVRCDEVAARYKDKIDVRYYFKPNSGRSLTRNYGMERAAGDYLVFFDSDCVIPEDLDALAALSNKLNLVGNRDQNHAAIEAFKTKFATCSL